MVLLDQEVAKIHLSGDVNVVGAIFNLISTKQKKIRMAANEDVITMIYYRNLLLFQGIYTHDTESKRLNRHQYVYKTSAPAPPALRSAHKPLPLVLHSLNRALRQKECSH